MKTKTKKQVKIEILSLKNKLIKVMKSEKNIVYTGNDNDFADKISFLYGSLSNVLNAVDEILDA
jgi:hypothetical protein